MQQKAPGQTTSDAYNSHGPNAGKTFDGRDIPPWNEFALITQERWAAAEKAAGRLRLDQFPPVAHIADDIALAAFARAQSRYSAECVLHNAPLLTRVLLECFEDELSKLSTAPPAILKYNRTQLSQKTDDELFELYMAEVGFFDMNGTMLERANMLDTLAKIELPKPGGAAF